MLLALAPSFSASAVAPLLARGVAHDRLLDLPILTVAVQLGFAVGAIGLAVTGAPDVIPGPRLFAAGALVAASRNLGFALLRDRPGERGPVPPPHRGRPGGGVPGRA